MRYFLIVCGVLFGQATYAQQVKLSFNNNGKDQDFGRVRLELPFELENIDEFSQKQWGKLLTLYVGKENPTDPSYPGVLGTYTVDSGDLVFRPRFILVPDQHYCVSFNSGIYNKLFPDYPKVTTDVSLTKYVTPIHVNEAPEVLYLAPEVKDIPQNVLRFYLYFSHSMSYDNPYDYLTLVNATSQEISDAFVEVKEGLWNTARDRLTIFIHPGRIKRAVGPNVVLGPVFEVGQTYEMRLRKEIKDDRGVGLSSDFVHQFQISKPVYQKINPADWEIKLPKMKTRDALVIKTNSKLDPVLATRMIKIVDHQGMEIFGKIQIMGDGLTLSFDPKNPWTSSDYRIQIDKRLEDVCGNTPLYVFDKEVHRNEDVAAVQKLELRFSLQ